MIPDGCSTELLSIGRWLNRGLPLSIDPHIRGLVRTYCSDSPIGDSAPTGSAYATGHRSRDGFISTYPDSSMSPDGTRFATDSILAFRPLYTLMEAAQDSGMGTGLVFTCHFPHATPAAFLAHTPNRDQYNRISRQMVHQACDVMLGGGSYYIDSSMKIAGYSARQTLDRQGIHYTTSWKDCQNSIENGTDRIWGLFTPMEMDYEIDRDTSRYPSLAEMTQAAIQALSSQQKGFFLMVEGSKIDWGSHNQDAPATIHDFLAFDRAVGVALDFARKQGNTLVIILPDHQTGGLTLGSQLSSSGYARISKDQLFSSFKEYKASAWKCAGLLNEFLTQNTNPQEFANYASGLLREQLNLSITSDQSDTLFQLAANPRKRQACTRAISQWMKLNSYLGWTTYGHHGGDVFLAVLQPEPLTRPCPTGVVDNESIAPYIAGFLGWDHWRETSLEHYLPLQTWFPEAHVQADPRPAELRVRLTAHRRNPKEYMVLKIKNAKGRNQTITLIPDTRYAQIGKEEITLPDLILRNGQETYLGKGSAEILKKKLGL